jgi:PKD repeat protein
VSGPVVAPPGPTGVVHSDGTSVLSDTPVNMSEINLESLSYVSSTVTVVSGPPAFLSGWSYRKIHAIGGSPDGDLTNYQMRFVVWRTTGTDSGENVYVGSSVKSDFGDLRFTTVAGTQIPYWVESVNTTAAVVWVKVPSIPRAGTQIILYSDNASAVSASNGNAVFEFFEDFESGSTSGWTVDSGVSFTASTDSSVQGSYSGKFVHPGGSTVTGIRKSLTGRTDGILEYSIRPVQTNKYHRMNLLSGLPTQTQGTWTAFTNFGQIAYQVSTWTNLMGYSPNTWYKVRIDANDLQKYDVSVNNQRLANDVPTRGSFTSYNTVCAYGYDGGTAYYDNIFIRKYVSSEPVHGSWGSEEILELAPIANFTASPVSGRAPLTVQFNDTSQHRPTSWTWNFGDSGTSTLQNPIHRYETANTYTVTLQATNSIGSDTKSASNYITASAAPGFLSGWTYRKEHLITGANIQNYQMRFVVWNTAGTDNGENVYLDGHVKPDFSDLRFTDDANNLLPYWIEQTSSTNAVVWVKMPLISSGGTYLYIYSDNASAVSASNGNAVFEFFEDFESGSTSGWTVDSGVSFTASTDSSVQGSYSGKFVHPGGSTVTGIRKSLTGRTDGILEYSIRPVQTNKYHRMNLLSGLPTQTQGTWTAFTNFGQIAYQVSTWTNLMGYSPNTWYKVRIDANDLQKYDVSVNNQRLANDVPTRGSFTSYNTVCAYGYDGGTAYYDNIFIRKYVSSEPVHGYYQ